MPSERSVLVQCKRHQRCLNIPTIFSPHGRDLKFPASTAHGNVVSRSRIWGIQHTKNFIKHGLQSENHFVKIALRGQMPKDIFPKCIF